MASELTTSVKISNHAHRLGFEAESGAQRWRSVFELEGAIVDNRFLMAIARAVCEELEEAGHVVTSEIVTKVTGGGIVEIYWTMVRLRFGGY